MDKKTPYRHHLQREGQLTEGRSGHSWVEVEEELQKNYQCSSD